MRRPLSAVVFDVSALGIDVTVSPNSLTFIPSGWDTAQSVTVTSRADNSVVDGDTAYTVTVSVDDDASHATFDDLDDQTLTGMVTDDDVAGFTLDPAGGASTLAALSEGGSTTFTARLNRAPLTAVTLSITSTDTSAATVSVSTLVFSSITWGAAQTVSVSGVTDGVVDGAQSYVISVVVAPDSDASYSGVVPQQLSGQVTDADVAIFTLNPSDGSSFSDLAEGSNIATFTVVLGAEPLSAVVFDVSALGIDVTVSPNSLTFIPSGWNSEQTVTVTSRVDNDDLDGDAAYTVTVSVNDGASAEAFDDLLDQTLTGMVTDDDVAGFMLAPAGGAAVLAAISEVGSTTFTALLNRAPPTDVTLSITSSDPGEATVSVSTLVFSSTTWNTAQTVSVIGVADDLVDGAQNYIISVAVAAGSDASYSSVEPQQLSGQVTDVDVAIFTLVPSDGSSLSDLAEGSSTATFTVVLGAEPLSDVVFDVSALGTDVTVSPNSLTFIPSGWNTAQNVTVTSRADNNDLDGDAAYTVTVSVNDISSANAFDDLDDQMLSGIVTDDEVAGFTLDPSGGSTLAAISESGSTTFTARLNSAPLSNVTLSITSTASGAATVSVSTLVFSNTTATTEQTVSVSGVTDGVVDGAQNYVISVAVATGSDASYSSVGPQQLSGQVTDADVASFTLSPFGGAATLAAIAEGESTTTFTVVLDAEPLSDVVFDVSALGIDVTVSPNSLTFIPSGWNTAQSVTVTSRADNSVVDGDTAYTVTVSVDDDASHATFDDLDDQTLTGMVTDDDVAGFTLVPSDGSSLSDLAEGSNTATFTVVLGAEPLSAVVFDVSALGIDVTVSPNSLTFISSGWNREQTVTVTSRADNSVVDGDAAYTVTVSVNDGASAEAFDDLLDQTLSGMVTDDDVAGFTLVPADGSTLAALSEGGSTTFTARLNRAPLTAVTLSITSADTSAATVSVSTLVFSSITWGAAQTVSVSGVTDGVVDGAQSYVISVAVATGSDASYSGVAPQQLSGQVTDADVAIFTLDPSDGSSLSDLAEGSNTATFTVVLGAEPLSDVVFDVSALGTDVTVSPNSLTFIPSGWNREQTVTVTSRADNSVVDGDAAYTVTVSVDDDGSAEAFGDLDDQTLTGMVTDDDVAGFALDPAGGASTLAALSEGGSTTFTARLNRAPLTAVTLSIASTDTSAATVSVSTLVFSSITWGAAQTVSVSGVTDGVVDGAQSYVISVIVAPGSDASYSGVVPQQLSGQVTDADVAIFTLGPSDGSSLSDLAEGSNTATFTVVLGAEPLSDVVFDVSALGIDVTVSPNSLTFIPSVWNREQTVTVTSRADNSVVDGDAAYTVTVSVNDSSSANAFDDLEDQMLSGMVTDDDVAIFTLDPSDGSSLSDLAEGSNTATFTVVLGAEPLSDVVFDVSALGIDVTVSPNSLTFIPSGWNREQTVTVTSRADNNDLDGDAAYTVTVSVNDSSSANAFDDLDDQMLSGMVTDDEVAGFTLVSAEGSTLAALSEGGSTTFTARLNSAPLSNVTLSITSTAPGAATVSVSTLVFSNTTATTEQTVSVSGVTDGVVDGAQNYVISVAVATGSDASYSSVGPQQLSGQVTDADVAIFTLVPSDGSSFSDLTEGSNTVTFTVVLGAEPLSDVVFDVSALGIDVTVSPNSLTFIPSVWNREQTVTVTSRADNSVVDGDAAYTVTVSVDDDGSAEAFDDLDDQTPQRHGHG